jgi:5-methylcytosine-specific restriction endonuclease McrA
MLIDTVRCEVFNASYEPLNSVSARRALNLYLKGKATILAEHGSISAHSGSDIHPVPTQIVLNYMVKGIRATKSPAMLNQRNLFLRDGHTCQYCLRHKSELESGEILTRDHVYPKDLGGKDEWENVVTACVKCNNKKANKLLHEVGFKLLREPIQPSRFEIWNRQKKSDKKHAFS